MKWLEFLENNIKKKPPIASFLKAIDGLKVFFYKKNGEIKCCETV